MKQNLKGVAWFSAALLTCPCHLVILLPLLAGTTIGTYLANYQTAAWAILGSVFAISLYMGWRKLMQEDKLDENVNCCDVNEVKA